MILYVYIHLYSQLLVKVFCMGHQILFCSCGTPASVPEVSSEPFAFKSPAFCPPNFLHLASRVPVMVLGGRFGSMGGRNPCILAFLSIFLEGPVLFDSADLSSCGRRAVNTPYCKVVNSCWFIILEQRQADNSTHHKRLLTRLPARV